MDVASPKDGFIIKVFVQNGEHVTAGTRLLEMDIDDELRNKIRVEKLDEVRKEMTAQYEGDDLKVTRGLAQLSVTLAQSRFDFLSAIAQELKDQHKVGQIFNDAKLKGDMEAAEAKIEIAKSQLELKKFDQSVDRHKRISSTVGDLLENEKKVLDKKITRMIVLAPFDGSVTLKVAENSFCGQGDPLLSIA